MVMTSHTVATHTSSLISALEDLKLSLPFPNMGQQK